MVCHVPSLTIIIAESIESSSIDIQTVFFKTFQLQFSEGDYTKFNINK